MISVTIDEGTVAQLMDMGFPIEACKKAVFNTGNNGVEVAMNWVMEHMDDPGRWLGQLLLLWILTSCCGYEGLISNMMLHYHLKLKL